MTVSRELVGASSQPIILSILNHGDSYGYEIIKKVRTYSFGALQWKDGSLYPVLHRMQDDGLIESYWQETETGRRRKYYRISAAGQAQLENEKNQWLHVDAVLAHLWGLTPRISGGMV